jgi:uncharacterized protein YceH (UPF0502 family)
MLRGPQTAAELRTRTERLHPFLSLEEVERTLRELEERELVALQPRRPGQKEQRWAQLLGGEAAAEPAAAAEAPAGSLEQRVAALEERVARLESML